MCGSAAPPTENQRKRQHFLNLMICQIFVCQNWVKWHDLGHEHASQRLLETIRKTSRSSLRFFGWNFEFEGWRRPVADSAPWRACDSREVRSDHFVERAELVEAVAQAWPAFLTCCPKDVLPGGASSRDAANFIGLVLGCIETKFCK